MIKLAVIHLYLSFSNVNKLIDADKDTGWPVVNAEYDTAIGWNLEFLLEQACIPFAITIEVRSSLSIGNLFIGFRASVM